MGTRLGNLEYAYANRGKVEQAIEYFEEALEISEDISNHRREAYRSWNLGLVQKQAKLAQTIELMQVIVDFERESNQSYAENDAAYPEELLRLLSE